MTVLKSAGRVTVRVPATTANLGPGFDCFGCALQLYNTITFSLEGTSLTIEGCDEAYRGRDNLAVVAYEAVMETLGLPCEAGLHLVIEADIPVCRGLGSSAALLAAGALAADALHGSTLSREEILAVCTRIEGHPDNLAPALFGGLTASMMEENIPSTVRYTVHPSVHFAVLIPNFELSTHRARAVLPAAVPYADAVYNLSHAAVLARALELGDDGLIGRALRDRLHQPYRKELVPGWEEAERAARRLGACGFCLSGAGPTLLALTTEEPQRFAEALRQALQSSLPGWTVLSLAVDAAGAQVTR